MLRFAFVALMFSVCWLNTTMQVAGLEQDCPSEAEIRSHICPDDLDQTSLCNMSPIFLDTYSRAQVSDTHLFENCVQAIGDDDDGRVTGVRGCVAPRPQTHITFVQVEPYKLPLNGQPGIEQYFKIVLNFVVPNSQTVVPIKTILNGDEKMWTISAEHLKSTLTCKGDAMTAGSFELWFPLKGYKDESKLTEILDVQVEIEGLGLSTSWSGVFNLDWGIPGANSVQPDAFFAAAGPMFEANPLQIIVSQQAGAPTPSALQPDEGFLGLDSETIMALSISVGCAALLSAGALLVVRHRRSSGWASAGDKFNQASSHAQNESGNSIDAPSNEYFGSQLMNQDISTPLRVVAQVRKPPAPWRSPLASFRRHQTAGVMNATQIQELTEFLRMRDPKLKTEKQLRDKVLKLSMYQRADLIRALARLYGEVPNSMQNDRKTMKL